MTKASRTDADGKRHSFGFITARRGILQVTDEALILGDWKIPHAKIDQAYLLSTRMWFIPGYVLRVRTTDETYDFGLNRGRFWTGELPFPVQRMKARVRYSWFSILLRVALLTFLLYWLWITFGPGAGR